MALHCYSTHSDDSGGSVGITNGYGYVDGDGVDDNSGSSGDNDGNDNIMIMVMIVVVGLVLPMVMAILMVMAVMIIVQGAKKLIFRACHLGKLKLTFTSPNIISTSPKNVLMSRLISQFFCNLNSSKIFTCPSGKLITEFTSPIAKSTSPTLSDTTFFARCGGSGNNDSDDNIMSI